MLLLWFSSCVVIANFIKALKASVHLDLEEKDIRAERFLLMQYNQSPLCFVLFYLIYRTISALQMSGSHVDSHRILTSHRNPPEGLYTVK